MATTKALRLYRLNPSKPDMPGTFVSAFKHIAGAEARIDKREEEGTFVIVYRGKSHTAVYGPYIKSPPSMAGL